MDHHTSWLTRFRRRCLVFDRRCRLEQHEAHPHHYAVHQRLSAVSLKTLQGTPIEQTRFVVLDTETTGLKAFAGDEIVSIALIELHGMTRTGRTLSSLVNPLRPISAESTAIHHLTDRDVAQAPVMDALLPEIIRFIDASILVGHHIQFDMRFLNKTIQKQCRCRFRHPWIDTMLLYLAIFGRLGHHTLDNVAQACQVEIHGRHTAYGDALATADIFTQLAPRLAKSHEPVARLIKRQHQFGHTRGSADRL